MWPGDGGGGGRSGRARSVTSGGGPSDGRCQYQLQNGPRRGLVCSKIGHTPTRCFNRLDDLFRLRFDPTSDLPDWYNLLRRGVRIFDVDMDEISSTLYVLYVDDSSVTGSYYPLVV
ncbi:hypothetical protein CLOP_g21918 [Closterium sp. NIES-67]|nr:hypothetical protein CLOP_g21918 [Closterium sp. NIES-67]